VLSRCRLRELQLQTLGGAERQRRDDHDEQQHEGDVRPRQLQHVVHRAAVPDDRQLLGCSMRDAA